VRVSNNPQVQAKVAEIREIATAALNENDAFEF
jgi:hypothetical protein